MPIPRSMGKKSAYTDVTAQWQADPTKLPITDLITVLHTKVPVGKSYVVSPREWRSQEPKNYPKRYKYSIYRCSTIGELAALLADLKSDQYSAIVPGLPANDWLPHELNLRRKETIFSRDTRWMILDFDLLVPKKWDASTLVTDTFNMIWRELSRIQGMPKDMPQCVWELSSGWGNPNAEHPKLHLYLRLDNPISLVQLNAWCKHAVEKHHIKLDPSVFRQAQLIYTAAPDYIGDARYVAKLKEIRRVYTHPGEQLRTVDLLIDTPVAKESVTTKPKPGDDKVFEYVLKRLGEEGMLLTDTPREGTRYDVVCPLAAEHSSTGNSTSTSIMAPDSEHGPSFWCQHANSHADGKNGWSWFLKQLVEDGVLNTIDIRTIRQTAAKSEFEQISETEHRSNWLCQQIQDSYIYIARQNKFFDRTTNQVILPETLRTMHPAVWLTTQDKINGVKPSNPVKAFMRSDMHVSGGVVAADERWRPSNTGLLLTRHGQLYLNSWRGFKIEPVKGDASAFHEHMAVLCPDPEQRSIFTDFLAHMFQYPDERPKWAIIHVVATQGLGRGLLHELMTHLLGEYARTVSLKQMVKQDWNEYLYKTLWVATEETSTSRAREASDRLKDLITLTKTDINPKGGAFISNVDVFSRMFFMTNHLNALPIDPTDRRFWVCGPEDQHTKPQNYSYYTRLAGLIEDPEFQSAVMYDLLNRDLKNFKYGEVPPKTDLMYRMIEAGQSVVQEAMAFIRHNKDFPPFATVTQLMSWIKAFVFESKEHWTQRHEREAKNMIRSLQPMGGRDINSKVKMYMVNGSRLRFYVLRDKDRWHDPSNEIVKKTYMKYLEAMDK